MDDKPDMLLVMSDQHGYMETGFADGRVDTPNLKRIAQEGLLFERCYCNAPLCVPSRMSFLSGQLPSELGIFNNDSSLPADMPTIAHELGRLGYETVLIGRMHFKGEDQKHGFDCRLCGDITSQYWGTGGRERKDFGIYAGTTNRRHCTEIVGGGISPVMVYDGMVQRQAISFLQNREGNKPLFLVVGFYSPHFPFVCRKDLYRKYQERYTDQECEQAAALPALPIYEDYIKRCPAGQLRNFRAAYCGLAEELDTYVGELYDCFRQSRKGKSHRFFYVSDHGEQLGRRGIFGKQTLYEHAVRVPFVVSGSRIPRGVLKEPVSLLDVSRTLLKEAGQEEGTGDWHRGRAIDLKAPDRWGHPVVMQQMLEKKGRKFMAEGAVLGTYKVVRADGIFYVYDLEADRLETQNLVEYCPQKARSLINRAVEQNLFLEEQEIERLILQEEKVCARQKRLKEWGRVKKPEEWGTVKLPPGAIKEPVE